MNIKHIEIELNAVHGKQAVDCLNVALQNTREIENMKNTDDLNACINQQIGYVSCMVTAGIINEESRDNFFTMLNELGNKRLQEIKRGKKGDKWLR